MYLESKGLKLLMTLFGGNKLKNDFSGKIEISNRLVQNKQKNDRNRKNRQNLTMLKNGFIHIKKGLKYDKIILYTELSTLSTSFFVKSGNN